MTLASVKVIETYIAECPEHPDFAIAPTRRRDLADRQVEWHNQHFHPDTEGRD